MKKRDFDLRESVANIKNPIQNSEAVPSYQPVQFVLFGRAGLLLNYQKP